MNIPFCFWSFLLITRKDHLFDQISNAAIKYRIKSSLSIELDILWSSKQRCLVCVQNVEKTKPPSNLVEFTVNSLNHYIFMSQIRIIEVVYCIYCFNWKNLSNSHIFVLFFVWTNKTDMKKILLFIAWNLNFTITINIKIVSWK